MKKAANNGKELGFSTLAIHAGQAPAPGNGAIMTPVYLSTTYVQKSPGVHQGYEYSRTKNPTRTALEENLAALEKGKYGLCFASGCAAADTVMHLFEAGDHVICSDDVYGGTFRLFDKVFRRLGINFTFVDLTDLAAFRNAFTEKTKLVWVETPTNPMLKIIDLKEISARAHEKKVLVAVDNTFASPYLQQPLLFGADIVLHSSTKYLGGHSDVIGGALIVNDQRLAEKLYFLQNAVGAVPSPMDSFLLLRSTKTLAIRMEQHCKNAKQVVAFLSQREDLEKVIYPGLETHPQYVLAKKQMRDSGGMISVVLKGGLARSQKFLERVKLFSLAESLGGVESLIEHPAIMTHASVPSDLRLQLGISDGFVRLSVGIEDVEDLIEDLRGALDSSRE